jgi:ribosomal protein L32
MAVCSECGNTSFRNGACMQCGVSPQIGPGSELEVEVELESEAEIKGRADWKVECPQCHNQTFDNWDCSHCGYGIPEKTRKAVGQICSPEEAYRIRKILGEN